MSRAQQSDRAGLDLTPRQCKVMQAIEDSIQRYGYGPTLREIGEAAGLTSTRNSWIGGWVRKKLPSSA